MGVVVMKFGGTSVATPEKILLAARRAIAEHVAGNRVVVVVSARGKATDDLIELAFQIDPSPPSRELDVLVSIGEQESIALFAMAVHKLGRHAVSLTGGQLGIVTDNAHGKARIVSISTKRIERIFEEEKIAVVAGFQGVDEERNITTLGRGGSDTTAVAVAAALRADVCDIYTDVDGVFTTDPRQDPTARKLDQISYDEMLELASVGAGVMHSRSIEFAKKFGVVIHVRNASSNNAGTIVRPEAPEMEHVVVRAAALAPSEVRITVRDVPDRPGLVYGIFSRLSAANIVVDMIVQNIAVESRTSVSFTTAEPDLTRTLELVEQAAQEIGAGRVDYSTEVSKLSVVGLGMRVHSGVADRMFRALADIGANIHLISTSEIKISVLVDRALGALALRAVHREFSLHEKSHELRPDPRFLVKGRFAGPSAEMDERLREIVRNVPRMEDVLVTDVEIDENQGRVTLWGVPDRPGVAAAVFAAVASANVAVDMIVQGVGDDGSTHLSLTTALKSDLEAAVEKARSVLPESAKVDADADMAKLSVRGVGMRSHSEVAVRMFRALADADVNIQLINTSELHITVVVRKADGATALQALRREFGLNDDSGRAVSSASATQEE